MRSNNENSKKSVNSWQQQTIDLDKSEKLVSENTEIIKESEDNISKKTTGSIGQDDQSLLKNLVDPSVTPTDPSVTPANEEAENISWTDNSQIAKNDEKLTPTKKFVSWTEHYELISTIGEGGFGKVYKVKNKTLGRTEALKKLERVFCKKSIQSFRKEAKAISQLKQRAKENNQELNIPEIYELREKGGIFYYTMEFIAGSSLKQHIKKQPLNLPEAIEIMSQVANILQIVHNANIIHRDIKPHNILLDKWQRIYLIDFGLVKLGDNFVQDESFEKTKPNQIMGTFSYIPPELLNNQPATLASDIYSLGVTFYELLANELPIPMGESVLQSVFNISQKEPLPISTIRQDIPLPLEQLCLDMLNKEPQKRPSIEKVCHKLSTIDIDVNTNIPVLQSNKTTYVIVSFFVIFCVIFFFAFGNTEKPKTNKDSKAVTKNTLQTKKESNIKPIKAPHKIQYIKNLSTAQKTYAPGQFVLIHLDVIEKCFVKVFLISVTGKVYLFFPNQRALKNHLSPGKHVFGKTHKIKKQVAWKADRTPGTYGVVAVASRSQFTDITEIKQQLQKQLLVEVDPEELQRLQQNEEINYLLYHYQIKGK